MKINCGPSWEVRYERRCAAAKLRVAELRSWQPWFAWYPVRLGEDDCRWLETIERRFPLAWSMGPYTGVEETFCPDPYVVYRAVNVVP